jgi:hypothetical protein
LFSVTDKQKYKMKQYPEYAIYGSAGYGPTFGGGHDFYIAENSIDNQSSYFNVPYTYDYISEKE